MFKPPCQPSPEAVYNIQVLKSANIKNTALDLIFENGFKYNMHFIFFLCVNDGLYTKMSTHHSSVMSVYVLLKVQKVGNIFSYKCIFSSVSLNS